MFLKRMYDMGARPPVVTHVKILRAGPRWRIPAQVVAEATAEGWMTLADGIVTLKAYPPVRYKVLRGPGLYCCHCGQAQTDRHAVQAHLLAEHRGKASPDAENPSGYARLNYFDCVKEPDHG